MRRVSTWIAAFLIALAAQGAQAARGTVYGQGVKAAKALSVSEILANPDAYVGKVVRVKGTITDVCPMRGCWIKIAGDKGPGRLTFKVTDGVMVFPKTAKGRRGDVEGVFSRLDLDDEEAIARARHQAEEQGVPYDPKVFPPVRVVYLLKGTGAVVD